MNSVFEEFRKKGLNYSASSLSELSITYNKYNVFLDDTKYFASSSSPSDQWWQVSFQKPVYIYKYLIKDKTTYCNNIIDWIVNVSIDNINWKTVSTVNNADIKSDNAMFNLDNPVTCAHFRIVAKRNGCPSNGMLFTYIDIYGSISKVSILGCTCKRRCSKTFNIAFAFIIFLFFY